MIKKVNLSKIGDILINFKFIKGLDIDHLIAIKIRFLLIDEITQKKSEEILVKVPRKKIIYKTESRISIIPIENINMNTLEGKICVLNLSLVMDQGKHHNLKINKTFKLSDLQERKKTKIKRKTSKEKNKKIYPVSYNYIRKINPIPDPAYFLEGEEKEIYASDSILDQTIKNNVIESVFLLLKFLISLKAVEDEKLTQLIFKMIEKHFPKKK